MNLKKNLFSSPSQETLRDNEESTELNSNISESNPTLEENSMHSEYKSEESPTRISEDNCQIMNPLNVY